MAVLHESHTSALLCMLIVALGPIQIGFTNGFSSPTWTPCFKILDSLSASGINLTTVLASISLASRSYIKAL